VASRVSDEMFTYVSGDLLGLTEFSLAELEKVDFNLGRYLALINKNLSSFDEHFEMKHEKGNPFIVQHTLSMRPEMNELVKDRSMQDIMVKFLNDFEADVLPKLDKLRKGLIHADFNDLNITVSSKEDVISADSDDDLKKSFGCFDFEDSHFGYYVFELAICMTYATIRAFREKSENPWKLGGKVLAGYNRVFPLNEHELDVLFPAVASRLCVSFVFSHAHAPEMIKDNELIFFHSGLCEPLLRDMLARGRDNIVAAWRAEIAAAASEADGK